MSDLSELLAEVGKGRKLSADDREKIGQLFKGSKKDESALFGSIVRHAAGLIADAPKLPASLQYDAGKIIGLLLRFRAGWEEWDRRILSALAAAPFWGKQRWELYVVLRREVTERPDEDVFGIALASLPGAETEAKILNSALEQIEMTDDGEINSFGRWILERLKADPEAILAVVGRSKKADDARLELARLVLRAAPETFEGLRKRIAFEDPVKFDAYLVGDMLDVDAKKYAKEALEIAGYTEDPAAVLPLAKALHEHLGEEVADRLIALGKTALKDLADAGVQGSDLRLEIATWLMESFGEKALDALTEYREEYDSIRLDYYAAVKKHLGTAGTAILVDGLCYPVDPKHVYGFQTPPKYVARILELLKGVDLAPHAERIQREAGGGANKTKSVQDLIKVALGKAEPKPKKAPKPRAATATYAIDTFAEKTAALCIAAVVKEKERVPAPVTQVKLATHDGAYRVSAVVIGNDDDTIEIEVAEPPTKIPAHTDEVDETDRLLPAFLKANGLSQSGDGPSWGDAYELPECIFFHEMVLAAREVVAALRKKGIDIAADCTASFGDHDSDWDDPEEFETHAREGMTQFADAAVREDFAAMCLSDPKKRQWLLGGK